MRATRAFSGLLAIFLGTLLLIGCDGGGGVVPPPGPTLDFGPPFNSIIYVDSQGHIGTASPSGYAKILYVRGVGTGAEIPDPGYTAYIRPRTSLETPDFIFYDVNSGAYQQLNEGNGRDQTYENAVEDMVYLSSGGSRIVYVRENADGSQTLKIEGMGTTVFDQEVTTLSAPSRFASRPVMNQAGSRIVVSEFNDSNPALSRLAVYSELGTITSQLAGRVYAPTFNPAGTMIAYIDGPDGAIEATDLVLVNDNYDEVVRYTFGDIAQGASALTWSPSGRRIAMFTGVYTSSPSLVIYDLDTAIGQEVLLDSGKVAVDMENHPNWAFPEWSASNDSLVFCVSSDSDPSRYSVVVSDLNGTLNTLAGGLSKPCHPTWHALVQ